MVKTTERFVNDLDNNDYDLVRLVVSEGLRYSKCEGLPSVDYRIAFEKTTQKDIIKFVSDLVQEAQEEEEISFQEYVISELVASQVPFITWYLVESIHFMDLEELEEYEGTIEEKTSEYIYHKLYSLINDIVNELEEK